MIDVTILEKLFCAFPDAVLDASFGFCGDQRTMVKSRVGLYGCFTERDVAVNLLEWFSFHASVAEPYKRRDDTEWVQKYHRDGINKFLHTEFSREDMVQIYHKLGNGINRELTEKFIDSGYDMEVLRDDHEDRKAG